MFFYFNTLLIKLIGLRDQLLTITNCILSINLIVCLGTLRIKVLDTNSSLLTCMKNRFIRR